MVIGRGETVYDAQGAIGGGSGSGVTPPSAPATLDLLADDPTVDLQVVENGGAVLAVTISFSTTALEAVDPDAGTSSVAHYLLAPSQTLAIGLKRGAGSPATGSTVCVVTIDYAGGSLAVSVTVEATSSVPEALANIVGCTLLYDFAASRVSGNNITPRVDTHGIGVLTKAAGASIDNATKASFFEGELIINSALLYAGFSPDRSKVNRSADRTVVLCGFFTEVGTGEKQLLGATAANVFLAGLGRNTALTPDEVFAQHNGYYDGTPPLTNLGYDPAVDGAKLGIVCMSWDHAAADLTVHVWFDGDGDWTSYLVEGLAAQSGTGAITVRLGGHQSKAFQGRWGALGVYDAAKASAAFAGVAAAMQLT